MESIKFLRFFSPPNAKKKVGLAKSKGGARERGSRLENADAEAGRVTATACTCDRLTVCCGLHPATAAERVEFIGVPGGGSAGRRRGEEGEGGW